MSDFESSDFIIEEDEATYVIDRGYPSRKNLMDWLEKVNFGISKEPVRYNESLDEKDRTYRILTTRMDLTDQQILEIYKNR